MEQHPVPQNVTTFQFRLIGDMTIKQFGYLAGGAIGGYVFYKLPLPFFFTWPLATTSVLLGIGLAFVPIEERPMDIWLLSFLKSIYSPTQYLWSREAGKETPPIKPPSSSSQPSPSSISKTIGQLFAPTSVPPKIPPSGSGPALIVTQHIPWDPLGFLKNLFTPKRPVTRPLPSSAYPDIFAPTTPPSLTGKKMELSQAPQAPPGPQAQAAIETQAQAFTKEKELTEKLEKLEGELTTKTTTDNRILELQKQLADILSERSKMEQELTSLRQRLTQAAQPPQTIRQAGVVAPPTTAQPTVRVISPDTAIRAGLPRLTTFPNVVTGIIKDAEGNLLPGVLITVRDKDDTPVRALKTNKLGQFAASTPLPNGTFTVDIEDPRGGHFFDRVRVTLNGSILAPVEVTSKSKKEMDRSRLAQEIFGGPNL
ncbi:PrgI family protein [Candidatus Gottesmanbacteria bacterium]|nr:PrgI family protein [Candidatus Gottesmanbacteria bacterium]